MQDLVPIPPNLEVRYKILHPRHHFAIRSSGKECDTAHIDKLFTIHQLGEGIPFEVPNVEKFQIQKFKFLSIFYILSQPNKA